MSDHNAEGSQLRRELMALDLATLVITRCSRELSSAGIEFRSFEPHLVRVLAEHIRPMPAAEEVRR